jgi:hypothetical protein
VFGTEIVCECPPPYVGAGTITIKGYKWFNSAHGEIAGQVASSYWTGGADTGDQIRCEVTLTSDVTGDAVVSTDWSPTIMPA